MKTVVLQSFRNYDVSPWMPRCLASVKAWAQQSGYEYRFVGDELFDLCGADYLARVGDNKRSITNLARLELVRNALREGFERAIWFDADMFVFAPDRLTIDITEGYAFCKESWISQHGTGEIKSERIVNNAALVFTRDQPDLDLLIALIRHVVAHRAISSNFQVGGWLLTGLERTLSFPLLRTIGMISPPLMHAIANGDTAVLQRHGAEFGDPMYAANMGLSLETLTPREVMADAMDRLEETRGDVLNRYVPRVSTYQPGVHWTRNG